MKKNNKGFTLAELLIVVAIIAVLTAIAIPVFNGNLEKAKESADAANLRAAYAMAAAASLDNDGADVVVGPIAIKDRDGYKTFKDSTYIGNFKLNDANFNAESVFLAFQHEGSVGIAATSASANTTAGITGSFKTSAFVNQG